MTLVAIAAVLLSAAAPQDFARDIAPVFAARCLPCHGPEKQRSGYRLDNRDVALRGGERSAPNLVPGKASESPLLHYVTAAADDDMRMPPKGDRLSADEVARIRAWIDAGAPWPEEASTRLVEPEAHPATRGRTCGREPDRCLRAGATLPARSRHGCRSRCPHAVPPGALRPHRPAAHGR